MERLNGTVVLVIGASRGIGAAIATRFAEEGAEVVLSARRRGPLDEQVRQIVANGGRAHAILTDIENEVSVAQLFVQIARRFDRLDVLVNSAGTGGPSQPIANLSTHTFMSVVATNLRGTFLCCREGFRLMKSRGGGTIINVSSLAGIRAWPGAGAYCASKHGVMGLTKALAHEGRDHGITVTALCPGGVARQSSGESDDDTSHDYISPSDVAAAAVFLALLGPQATIHQLAIDQVGGHDW